MYYVLYWEVELIMIHVLSMQSIFGASFLFFIPVHQWYVVLDCFNFIMYYVLYWEVELLICYDIIDAVNFWRILSFFYTCIPVVLDCFNFVNDF